jgi:acetylornithine deacetylase/succinyl-diaminopimelate desuccinylase-like protein
MEHKQITDYIATHKDRFVNELIDLLKIPSISADKKYEADTLRMAQATADKLKAAGADKVALLPTDGYPIVYGEKMIDPSKPTVIVYGHYDVQPPDPLELWTSPPFEPVIKDGKIYARGSADDKGQFYMHVKAFEFMMQTNTLPCNVKFMIEGEEEIGSGALGPFLRANKDLYKGDIIIISDTSMISNEQPSIDTGLRGLAYMEVEVIAAKKDLHSGVYGGAVANPINVLCEMIASMHDENKHISIPGFYEAVLELTNAERMALNLAPFDLEEYKKELGIDEVMGEKGYTTIERTGIRPTLDVNGIWGGYTGEGSKTVLPSKANAKISMRLVPNQDHHKISDLFAAHFKKIAPKGVKVTVTAHHGGNPVVCPTDSKAYLSAEKALTTTFGKKPIPTRGGGSIPIVALFEEVLGLKSLLMGFGLDSDGLHSPNEHYGIFNYLKGIESIPLFFKNFSEK